MSPDFPAALRHDCIEVPWLQDDPINGARFRLHVEEPLLPRLKPGGTVFMDNQESL